MTTLSPTFELSTDEIPAIRAMVAPTGVEGTPRLLLRLEGAAVLAVALAAYLQSGGSWSWLALLFLLPDITLLGYFAGPRVGAALYNVGHSYLGPLGLIVASGLGGPSELMLGALIWASHIGFDRMMGYGLKHGSAFAHTHLGRISQFETKSA